MLPTGNGTNNKRPISEELFNENALAYAETMKALVIAMQGCEHDSHVKTIAYLLLKILPDENQINFKAK